MDGAGGSENFFGVWSPTWQLPFESAYNLIQKYAWANVMNGRDIWRNVIGRKHINPNARLDLLVSESGLRTAKLPPVLEVERAFLSHYGTYWPPLFAWSEHLRFCAQCLVFGYHSAFHQFAAVAKCPIHEDTLRTACPHCNSQTPPPALTSSSFEGPFCCDSCERPLASDFEPQRWCDHEFAGAVHQRMKPISEWLSKLPGMATSSFGLEDHAPLQALALHDSEIRQTTQAAWFEVASKVVPFPSPHCLDLPKRPVLVRRLTLRKVTPPTMRPRIDELDESAAKAKKAIVKSIRRQLRRSITREHRICIRKAREAIVVHNVFGRELYATDSLCVYGAAYVRWCRHNAYRGYLVHHWGSVRTYLLNKYEASLVSPWDPDHVIFAWKTLFEFYSCAATAVAFNELWRLFKGRRIFRPSEHAALTERCAIGWNDAWSLVLDNPESQTSEWVFACASPGLLETLGDRSCIH